MWTWRRAREIDRGQADFRSGEHVHLCPQQRRQSTMAVYFFSAITTRPYKIFDDEPRSRRSSSARNKSREHFFSAKFYQVTHLRRSDEEDRDNSITMPLNQKSRKKVRTGHDHECPAPSAYPMTFEISHAFARSPTRVAALGLFIIDMAHKSPAGSREAARPVRCRTPFFGHETRTTHKFCADRARGIVDVSGKFCFRLKRKTDDSMVVPWHSGGPLITSSGGVHTNRRPKRW